MDTTDTEQTIPNIPVERNNDWSENTPARDIEYIQYDGELDRMVHAAETAEETGLLPRFRLTGPSGCGKTLCAEALATELDAPYFEVQGEYDQKRSSIVGHPVVLDGTTYWVDKQVVEAMLASQDGKTVLLYDESNRTRGEAKAVLFPILDGRVSVRTGRGNEIIEGNPSNLIVVVTTNEGSEYQTQNIGFAEERRYGATFPIDYLGQEHFDAEVKVLTNQSEVHEVIARLMVHVALTVRNRCPEEDSPISRPIPTASLVRWAQTAHSYELGDSPVSNPILGAGKDIIISSLYRDAGDAAETVKNVIVSHLDEAPVTGDAVTDWASDELFNDDGMIDEDVLEEAGITQNMINSTTGNKRVNDMIASTRPTPKLEESTDAD